MEQAFWTHTQNGKYGFDTMEDCLNYADFYNDEYFPHITKFDSVYELEGFMYDDGFLQHIHEEMMEDNEVNKKKVYAAWKEVLES